MYQNHHEDFSFRKMLYCIKMMCLIEVETLYFLTQFFFIRVIKYLRTLLILFCWVLFTILAFIFKSKIG